MVNNSINLDVDDINGIAVYKSLLGGQDNNWISEVYLENPDRYGLGQAGTIAEALQIALDRAGHNEAAT